MRAEDRYRLHDVICDMTFVDRSTSDAKVLPLLARFPLCREFRRRNPLALKLLDIPLLAVDGTIACCDTDVLAFRRFSGVFDWPDAETTAIFMPDGQSAYALRPWHLVGRRAVSLATRINTGLMLFRKREHDLDFIEWFLGRRFNVYERIPGWVEQTCWAALAHRGHCRLYDSAQVRVIRDGRCLVDPSLVIGHFTSNVRHLWDRTQAGFQAGPAVPVLTCRSEPLSAARLAAEQVRRAATRSRAWIRGKEYA